MKNPKVSRIAGRLNDMGRRVGQPRTMQEAALVFYAMERKLFETRGGGRWRYDKPSTMRQKKQRGQPHSRQDVLRASLDLERSLTNPPPTKGAYLSLERGNTVLRLGSTLPYAAIQRATGRPPIIISPEMRRRTLEAIRAEIMRRNG